MIRRSFSVVALSISGLLVSTPAPVAAADLCLNMRIQCNGFEPNWQFVTGVGAGGGTVIRFIDPENPNWETEPLVIESCLLQGSPNDYELSTPEPLSMVANITEQSCIEPNEEVFDFSVNATFNQGALTASPRRVGGTGCCKRLN